MTGRAAKPQVLCAGRLYCDLVFTGVPKMPQLGQEVFADQVSLHAGGGAFITAATIAALGGEAALLSVLPAAPFCDLVQTHIEQSGVTSDLCAAPAAGASPQVTVATALGGDRAFLTHRSGPALPGVTWDGPSSHLHIGELGCLVEHPDLITVARDKGMTISLDCGWDEDLLDRGAKWADLIASVDVFLPNEAEFDALTGSGLNEDTAPLTVVKRGANGASAIGGRGWSHVPTHPVEALDPTGAGDAFNGGFLMRWLSGATLEECLKHANMCGANSVRYPGGTGGLNALRRGSAPQREPVQ